ncbi:prepilin-type N-terminal cleavage/methylation domain-containing protein [bacterium]|nr:prepilin-type N-terminal cleavage/methylation domain-containing protein [bacterium]
MKKSKASGFTLIELLIVVAIIGILAAIAVPNFLNAQIRARVARVQADFNAISVALESYRLDRNYYPPWKTFEGDNIWPVAWRLRPLTTPVSYMSNVPTVDPFITSQSGIVTEQSNAAYELGYNYGDAYSSAVTMKQIPLSADWRCSEWRIESAGPDGQQQAAAVPSYNGTNGLLSSGDIQFRGPRTGYPCNDSLVGN